MNRGAVFFDRDGVLVTTEVVNGIPTAENNPDEIIFVPGAIQLCKRLHAAEIQTFMITNQPDIARGKVSLGDVNFINKIVQETCNLTEIAVCPHDDVDNCDCRKPLPGMILNLASTFEIDLQKSIVVGDRWRDIEAGNSAGCRTILIDYKYGEKHASDPTHIVSSVEQVGLLLETYFDLDRIEEV